MAEKITSGYLQPCLCKDKYSIKPHTDSITITTNDLDTRYFKQVLGLFSTISMPEIEKVIFQPEHTIVIWADGQKTVVKCYEETFDKEKGLAMAIVKRYMDRGKFKRLIENAQIQE